MLKVIFCFSIGTILAALVSGVGVPLLGFSDNISLLLAFGIGIIGGFIGMLVGRIWADRD